MCFTPLRTCVLRTYVIPVVPMARSKGLSIYTGNQDRPKFHSERNPCFAAGQQQANSCKKQLAIKGLEEWEPPEISTLLS
jgi:hypothetical protein